MPEYGMNGVISGNIKEGVVGWLAYKYSININAIKYTAWISSDGIRHIVKFIYKRCSGRSDCSIAGNGSVDLVRILCKCCLDVMINKHIMECIRSSAVFH